MFTKMKNFFLTVRTGHDDLEPQTVCGHATAHQGGPVDQGLPEVVQSVLLGKQHQLFGGQGGLGLVRFEQNKANLLHFL